MRIRAVNVAVLAALTLSGTVRAQDFAEPRQPRAAAPAFPLTPQQGPWMIQVASFVGDQNLHLANSLASELRTKHRLEAYVFEFQPKSDLTQLTPEFVKEFKSKFKVAPRAPRYQTPPARQWVVLVGNYKSHDDFRLQRSLNYLKRINPNSFSAEVREELRWAKPDANGHKMNGVRAVVNPVAPKSSFQNDPENQRLLAMYRELNDHEKWSIYQLAAPATLNVYTFHGTSTLEQNKKDQVAAKNKQSSLEMAAQSALILTEELRKMGYEAYVFHGKFASCVSMGGYAGPNDPKLQQDFPKLLKMKVGQLQLEPKLMPTPRRPELGSLRAN